VAVHDLQLAVAERLTRPLEQAGLAARRRRLLVDAVGEVLDVGAGRGANLPHYRDADAVTALEPEPALSRRLLALAAEAAVPVQVVEATIEDAPFEAESFDTVVCTLVLCTVADPGRALRAIHRLLRPDGRLLFLEHVRAPGGWGRVQRAVTPVWKTVVPGCHLDRDPLHAMRASGFVVIDCEHFTLPLVHTRMGLAAQGAARRSRRPA
jgi:SAM-dependent methyltransferase